MVFLGGAVLANLVRILSTVRQILGTDMLTNCTDRRQGGYVGNQARMAGIGRARFGETRS